MYTNPPPIREVVSFLPFLLAAGGVVVPIGLVFVLVVIFVVVAGVVFAFVLLFRPHLTRHGRNPRECRKTADFLCSEFGRQDQLLLVFFLSHRIVFGLVPFSLRLFVGMRSKGIDRLRSVGPIGVFGLSCLVLSVLAFRFCLSRFYHPIPSSQCFTPPGKQNEISSGSSPPKKSKKRRGRKRGKQDKKDKKQKQNPAGRKARKRRQG